MNNSMTIEGSVSLETLDMNTAAYIEGLPCGEMSPDLMTCALEVTLDDVDSMTAHIKYTDGFPDQQTILMVCWNPGCSDSLTNAQFTQGWELLEWVQKHMPDCVPTLTGLANIQDDGLQLIGLRTPDLFAIAGCAYPLEL